MYIFELTKHVQLGSSEDDGYNLYLSVPEVDHTILTVQVDGKRYLLHGFVHNRNSNEIILTVPDSVDPIVLDAQTDLDIQIWDLREQLGGKINECKHRHDRSSD